MNIQYVKVIYLQQQLLSQRQLLTIGSVSFFHSLLILLLILIGFIVLYEFLK